MKKITTLQTAFLATMLALLTVNTSTFAGPQYIDESGLAASGYDVVAFRSLDQTTICAIVKQPSPVFALTARRAIRLFFNSMSHL